MAVTERWKTAQVAETEFWTGLSALTVQQILRANEQYARRLNSWVTEKQDAALEIGVGGLGVGTLGFVSSISTRIAVDPLPHVQPDCPQAIFQEILSMRRELRFVRASGEALPFASGYFGLVVSVNVLDHVSNAPDVVAEVFRVLRPGGLFFLGVDTFSRFGLAKWHLVTKHLHANEILVRAHPYRFLESHVVTLVCGAGFEFVRIDGRNAMDQWFGHSRMTHYLFRKPGPGRQS
jgi:SAM-dependent methyltransferase